MATGTSWAEQDRPFRLFIDEVMYPYPEMRWEPPPSEGVVDAGDPGGGSKTPRPRVRTTPIHGHERQVNCLAFNASGAQLASGSDDETARLWDAETSRCVLTLDGHGKDVAQLCWEPRSDRRLCTLCMDKTLRFFDARSGPRAVAAVKASQEYINVAWHHDAVTVAIRFVGGRCRRRVCSRVQGGDDDDHHHRDGRRGLCCRGRRHVIVIQGLWRCRHQGLCEARRCA